MTTFPIRPHVVIFPEFKSKYYKSFSNVYLYFINVCRVLEIAAHTVLKNSEKTEIANPVKSLK